ncbi:hypothetical protein JCM9957A_36200 [Kineosporia succinea]
MANAVPEGLTVAWSARVFFSCATLDPDIIRTTATARRKAATAADRRSAVALPRINRAESVHCTPEP